MGVGCLLLVVWLMMAEKHEQSEQSSLYIEVLENQNRLGSVSRFGMGSVQALAEGNEFAAQTDERPYFYPHHTAPCLTTDQFIIRSHSEG